MYGCLQNAHTNKVFLDIFNGGGGRLSNLKALPRPPSLPRQIVQIVQKTQKTQKTMEILKKKL